MSEIVIGVGFLTWCVAGGALGAAGAATNHGGSEQTALWTSVVVLLPVATLLFIVGDRIARWGF